MKAREMIFDFLNDSFLLVISLFFFFYFFLGGRLEQASALVKMFIPLAIFLLFLLIKTKFNARRYRKYKNEFNLDQKVCYLTDSDKIKDAVVVLSLPAVMLGFTALDKYVDIIDILQASAVFIVSYAWHLKIFRPKDEYGELVYITNSDKIKDEVIIFLLPVIVIAITLLFGRIDLVDNFQAVSVFVVMHFWRLILFKNRKNG